MLNNSSFNYRDQCSRDLNEEMGTDDSLQNDEFLLENMGQLPWCLVCGRHNLHAYGNDWCTNIFETKTCMERKVATCLTTALVTELNTDSAISQVWFLF